ncbi:MAG: hypothetical protein AMJ92_03790 [candidate division Zixibacteria bacterium SM23_81]|nr:MAG: hypothetical protein AMJ92_03790 [candidate division Zixibacteria bacterium SM23_81]
MAVDLNTRQAELLEKVARRIVDLRVSAMAIFLLESTKPLSFLGSQLLVFFNPIIQPIFNFKDYEEVTDMIENRDNIEFLIQRIERLQEEQILRDQEIKRAKKERKRGRR